MTPRVRSLVLVGAALLMALLLALSVGIWLTPTGSRPPITKVTGEALIGGPFTLIDHHGATVTAADFADRYMLVVFGYTFCPDVCPMELQMMSEALDLLADKAAQIRPLFITIDPDRDTVAVMADYVGNFHPSLVGLTGTRAQIRAAAKAYRIYYRKRDSADGEADEYLMDHSSFIYLMNRAGNYVTHFGPGTTPRILASGIGKVLALEQKP